MTGALRKENKKRAKSRQAEGVAYRRGVLLFYVEFVGFWEHGMHFSYFSVGVIAELCSERGKLRGGSPLVRQRFLPKVNGTACPAALYPYYVSGFILYADIITDL